MSTAAPPRQTQADRSRDTRLKLMRAVVECLIEVGWSGTTTTLVSERAGVSRGAQLHHFASRGELVAAAVEHLGAEGARELRARADALPRPVPTAAAVGLIVDFYVSPVFAAALELWVAARTDAGLRELVLPLQDRLGRESHLLAVELLGADEGRPGVREAVQATLDLARGLALAELICPCDVHAGGRPSGAPDPQQRAARPCESARRARIVAKWSAELEGMLGGPARRHPAPRTRPPTVGGEGA